MTVQTTDRGLSMEKVNEIVRSMGDLPPMPHVAAKVCEITANSESAAADLRRILEADQALTAQVLRVANSAFYGGRRRVADLTEAVVVLGFRTIQSLVVAASSKRIYTDSSGGMGPMEKLMWEHSLAAGFACRLLAAEVKYPAVEAAFVAGLLHDIGKALLNSLMNNAYAPLLREANMTDLPLHDLEQSALGFSHAEVGALLAEEWQLAPGHLETIRDHHRESLPAGHSQLLDLVRLANHLCHQSGFGGRSGSGAPNLTEGTLTAQGLDTERTEKIRQTILAKLESERAVFS